MVIGKVAIGRAIFKHQNRTNLLKFFILNNFLDVDDDNDVENTTNGINDTFEDIIELNQPDPAIVNLKNRKESKIQTGLVWLMVELQLIKLNKMAEEQR